MGFYRSLLEEELDTPILDDNNSPEIKEIEDIVNDQDANAEEQDDAQAAEFGPDDGVDDILDETFMAIAESNREFDQITRAIGIHELNETVAGREVIYEAVDIKGYFKKAKDWVVSFFKKVWSVLKRFGANIASVFKTNKGMAAKYSNQITAGAKLYDSKAKNKLKAYPYEKSKMDKILNPSSWNKDANSAVAEINKVSAEIKAARASNSGVVFSNDKVDELLSKYRASFLGSNCSADEFHSKLLDYIRGSEKTESKMDPAYVLEVLKFDGTKKVNEAIKSSRDEFKKTIRDLDAMEKSLKDAKSVDSDALGNVYRATDCYKKILNTTQVARSVMMKCLRGRSIQARLFAQAYIAAYNKDTHKGFQKESAEYGFLSNLKLV